MAKKSNRSRKWLNVSKGLTAFIAWEVSRMYGSVTIADCSRQITLDFSDDGDVAKLDKLIKELEKFRAARYGE